MFHEILNELYRQKRNPITGKQYTNDEVADGCRNIVSASHLARLRRGKSNNPSYDLILALANFFSVQPQYFFGDSAVEIPKIEDGSILELFDQSGNRVGNFVFRSAFEKQGNNDDDMDEGGVT